MFQQFYLFPHLTALENVMFGPLRVRGANKEEAEKLARELLAKVGSWQNALTTTLPSFLVVSNSVWRLPVRWR